MNLPLELLPPAAERVAWAVLHSLWQGAIIALLFAVLLQGLRERSAATRHAVCLGALVLMLMSACFTAIVVSPSSSGGHRARAQTVAADPTSAKGSLPSAPLLQAEDPVRMEASEPLPIPDPAPIIMRSWRDRLAPTLPWIAGLWICGVVVISIRHCGCWWRVRALRRSGLPAGKEIQQAFERLLSKFDLARVVRLLESAKAATPMLTGVLKPIIVLPARVLTGLGPAEIEAILAHELAHLARRETWSNLLQVVIETVLFYHPAVWWLSHRARVEREHAADDLALQVCADRRVYAGALVRLAEIDATPSLALAANGGDLLTRIRRIVALRPAESAPSSLSFGLPATIAALVFATLLGSRAIAEDPPILVGPGESIQAAVDKAPAGGVVRLGEGEWKERVAITKPLTLEGAGWEKTRITIDEPSPEELKAVSSEVEAAMNAASTPEQKKLASRERVRRLLRPGVWIHDTSGVKLQKVRLQGIAKGSRNDGGAASTLLIVQGAKALVSDCGFVGPFGNGINIAESSDVEIARSLVAAFWGEGIIVRGRGRDPGEEASRLHLVDSEVRNVYHYGVVLGGGCDSTVIERCRISGTAWHGIRYDNASPTITGNLIFGNARIGIYASGKTNAVVRGNVVWRNDMEGIWCLSGNADLIEGNTFVANRRGGIAVSDAKPTLTRNIIAGSPIGIAATAVGGQGGQSAVGEPKLVGNLFHENQTAMQVGAEAKGPPEGSVIADPKFRDATKQDFGLANDSPARPAGIGVAEPLSPSTRWPILAEEKSIIPADDSRDSAKWRASGAPAAATRTQDEVAAKARAQAEPWIADMFQLEDAGKRDSAIQRMRTAIYSSDPLELEAGLSAFTRTGDIQFDRAPYRDRFRELLKSEDGQIRARALQGLAQCGEHPDNLEIYIRLADDPAAEVRELVPGFIVMATKRDLTGRGGEAILKLLNQPDDKSRLPAIHCLWGVKQSPEIEARIVELSHATFAGGPGRSSYDAMYYALSTQPNRGEAAIRRCIELLADQDTHNVGGRIAWGFGSGVAKEFQPLVAEAMMRVLESRNDSYLRRQSIDRLRQYGTAAQLPALRALLGKPSITGEFRKSLEAIAAAIADRPAESSQFKTATDPQTPGAPSTEAAQIEVEWKGKWWPATVLKKQGEQMLIHYVGYGSDWDEWVVPARIRPLSVAAASEKALASPAQPAAELVEKNRQSARIRASKDRETYSVEQLREIETLYQVANTKGKRSAEARASLTELLEKYDKANRTGCATLYLGQASEGEERLKYLTTAVEKFSDCYYFNGCQVGGYGRYVLLLTLWDRGEKDKARALLNELKTTYKDATDHRGYRMGDVAEAVEKQFNAQGGAEVS